MRHGRKGRALGRNPNHQMALRRMLALALILTEREDSAYFDPALAKNVGVPKVKGRIITTLEKAKEVRPFIERLVTIARRVLSSDRVAAKLNPGYDRRSSEYASWRKSEDWVKWNNASAPGVAARRQVSRLLGTKGVVKLAGGEVANNVENKTAVKILFEVIAPRFEERNGGYTRIMRLAKPRLGDAGTRAILEFVDKNERPKKTVVKPSFSEE